jgi:hypothetical protein
MRVQPARPPTRENIHEASCLYGYCLCTLRLDGIRPLNQGQQTTPPNASSMPAQAQNPMPGGTGGFNNNEINGKSRNPDTTTPGTGPAKANPNQNQ